MTLLPWIIFIPFLYAVFIPYFYKKYKHIHTGWFVLPIPVLIFSYLISFISKISNGYTFVEEIKWVPTLGINISIYLDGLSYIFGLLISGIGALVILYSIFYLSKEKEALHNFYIYILLFMGAMLGVVLSDHIFVLYAFWELTSISSFLLIAYWYERRTSRAGAKKALLITVSGGLSMLAGLILISLETNMTSIREWIANDHLIMQSDLFVIAMILILIGALSKSAQFPFSLWLPDAMEAPTPISAYLHSATMVKAGIYLIARLTPVFGGSKEWFWIISVIGLITLFFGSFNAVNQKDLKGLLAYSTISQLGLITCLMGLGSAAMYFEVAEMQTVYAFCIFTALFHLVNHSTFKGSLFMIVGIIDHETGTRDLRKLGGLMTVMPISFTLALIGGFSMAGLPPFNGFLSKEMFFTSLLSISEYSVFGMETMGYIFPIIAWIASIFTFIYCMILVFKTFTGPFKPEKLDKIVHEAPIGMLISPIILVFFVVAIFFFPNVVGINLIAPALQAVLPEYEIVYENFKISVWHGFNLELWMTIGVIGIGLLLFLSIKKWIKLYALTPKKFTMNGLYQYIDQGLTPFSKKITNSYMTGYLRDYLIYILGFMILLVGGSFILSGNIDLVVENARDVKWFEVLLLVALVVGAFICVKAASRLTALIAIGVVGFLVALLFVYFQAPDLALTQLVVETITTALFLLAFRHFPQMKLEKTKSTLKRVNILIAGMVGVLVTSLIIAVSNNKSDYSIRSFYEGAYELAGAKNIVNAILVDFRGFDTMFEIVVLLMCGVGVYVLIKLPKKKEEENE